MGRKTVRNGFVSYSFETGGVIGLKAKTVPANKQLRHRVEVSAAITLLAVSVHFLFGVSRITFKAVRVLADSLDGAKVLEAGGGVDSKGLLEVDQLWGQPRDADDVT